MNTFFLLIQYWIIFQLILVIAIILFFIATRAVVNIKIRNKHKIINKINRELKKISHNPSCLNKKVIYFFKKNILEFIRCFRKANHINSKKKGWTRIRAIISEEILLPKIKILASSKDWLDRFLATQCYEIGLNIYDEDIILNLVNDYNLLVSINAAIIVFNNPTVKSINEVIDKFSAYRRIRQFAFVSIIEKTLRHPEFIIEIIINRLKTDQDLYARIFSYRILNSLAFASELYPFITEDLLKDNAELTITTLLYLEHVDYKISKPIFLSYLNNPYYQIRSIAVKLLANSNDKSVIPYLQSRLGDPAWLVRINAANALLNFGQEGIAALKSQSPHKDKFAYESAQAILKIYQERE